MPVYLNKKNEILNCNPVDTLFKKYFLYIMGMHDTLQKYDENMYDLIKDIQRQELILALIRYIRQGRYEK